VEVGNDVARPNDTDGDGTIDALDTDDDDDSLATADEVAAADAAGSADPDGDGDVAWLDRDSDDDGVPDGADDGLADSDGDGRPDFLDKDSNAKPVVNDEPPAPNEPAGCFGSAATASPDRAPLVALVVFLGLLRRRRSA
jgi:hypothetical protein